jgi:signal transduction histidine kinase
VPAMIYPTVRSWNTALAVAGSVGLIVNGLLQTQAALSPGDYALAVASASPLLWRTVAPLSALIAVELGSLACAAAFDASLAATGLIMVELYTVALLGDRQRSIVVGTVTAVVVIAAVILLDGSFNLAAMGLRIPLVLIALGGGELVRSRQALRTVAREREEHAAHEREEEGRRRLSEQRLGIARELHDTLAHSLVAMNVRAGVALDLRDAQDPYSALTDVKEASAAALRDLRATLSLLRNQDDAAPTAPAYGLDALAGLVEQARSAGLRAEFELDVDGVTVPTAIAGTAFRIVQESLTNILRHANASTARIQVRATQGSLDIDVADDGSAHPAGADVAPGLGLRGMVERANAVGGRLDAGPRSEGGWLIRAALPLDGSP